MLKPHLRVEQCRVQYRIGLTMSAPEWVPERDKTGMGRRVAERLQVGRDGAPFTDSIWQRADIVFNAQYRRRRMVSRLGTQLN